MEGQAFSRSYDLDLAPRPPPSPLPSVSSIGDTHKTEKEWQLTDGRGARSRIRRPQEGLILYKPVSTLCYSVLFPPYTLLLWWTQHPGANDSKPSLHTAIETQIHVDYIYLYTTQQNVHKHWKHRQHKCTLEHGMKNSSRDSVNHRISRFKSNREGGGKNIKYKGSKGLCLAVWIIWRVNWRVVEGWGGGDVTEQGFRKCGNIHG